MLTHRAALEAVRENFVALFYCIGDSLPIGDTFLNFLEPLGNDLSMEATAPAPIMLIILFKEISGRLLLKHVDRAVRCEGQRRFLEGYLWLRKIDATPLVNFWQITAAVDIHFLLFLLRIHVEFQAYLG